MPIVFVPRIMQRAQLVQFGLGGQGVGGSDTVPDAPNLSVMNRKAISGEIVLAVTTPVW